MGYEYWKIKGGQNTEGFEKAGNDALRHHFQMEYPAVMDIFSIYIV